MAVRALRSRKKDERGAAAIVVAGALVLVVIVFGLIVDGGLQRVDNRSMQGIADVTALDLSRRIDGVTNTASIKPAMNAQLSRTRARNSWPSELTLTYQLGRINAQNQFEATADTQVPSAVKVTASDNRQWLSSSRRENSTRSSIASATITPGGDCFSIGSYKGVLGTSGELGLNLYFQKMFAQAIIFGNTDTASNFDWKKVANEEINMTALGARMGYSSIDAFRNATVNLSSWYQALYQQLLIDAPSSETFRHVQAVRNMINNVPSMPMSKILGTGLKGTVKMNALDVLGGMMTYYNSVNNNPPGPRSVNPNFGSTFGSTFSQGPTNIVSYQGAKKHCAEAGQTISTAGDDANRQMYMQLNGTLSPQTYTTKFFSSGLINTTGPVTLGYMGLGLNIEPMVMKLNSVTCTPTSKTASFDLSKGSIDMQLPWRDANGSEGGTTYAGSSSPLYAFLNGYGAVKIEWGFNLRFKARLNLAPSTNNTVTATADTINKPLYISGNESRLTVDVSESVNNFSYFRVLKDSNQYQDLTNTLTSTDQRKLKEAIVLAYTDPLLSRTNSNSFFNNYINGSLGFGGSSVFGTSVMFDSLSCSSSGSAPAVKLVG